MGLLCAHTRLPIENIAKRPRIITHSCIKTDTTKRLNFAEGGITKTPENSGIIASGTFPIFATGVTPPRTKTESVITDTNLTLNGTNKLRCSEQEKQRHKLDIFIFKCKDEHDRTINI